MSVRSAPYARLTVVSVDVLLLQCAYAPDFNDALKQHLPYAARRWDPDARGWRIGVQYGQTVADLCAAYLGVTPSIPTAVVPTTPPTRETRLFEIRYLGKAKARDGGDWTASAWVRAPQPELPAAERGRGGWGLAITLQALRRYFEPSYALRDPGDDEHPDTPTAAATPPTLYDTLGVAPDADEVALKQGWRRMAMQWHPDRCHEPDAHERFLAVQAAFDLLRDATQRRRYDQGLQLEKQLGQTMAAHPVTWDVPPAAIGVGQYGWSPPQRAGYFLVAGRPSVRGFRATHILHAHDIVDQRGRVLVSSWPLDGDDFEELWCTP